MELFRPELYFTTFTTMSFSRPALKTFITVLKNGIMVLFIFQKDLHLGLKI